MVAKGYDILLAWNGDDYDFFLLMSRVRHLNIKVDWRQWNLLDYMLVVKRTLSSIPDPAFKRSFALDSVGENILGIRKIKLSVPAGKMYRLLKTSTTRAELEVYNRRDVEIMLGVDKKREFLTLHSALCSICRTFPNRSSVFPNELADGILLRLAVQEGVHFPTRIQTSVEENKYEGAFVLEPVTGFHMDVQVPDFASLYPSIILSWNMSNETKIQDDEELTRDVLSNSALASATGVRFRTDVEGIIPKALKQLISKRNEYKERAKKLPVDSDEYRNVGHLSTAVKVATNSFYGLIGSEVSRYYDRDIARSVTLTGQYLVRETIKFFEGKGHEVVGADTDSTFVKCSMSLMNEYLEEINDQFIPRILSRVGCKDNYVRMDFDKGYKSLLITTKKRYAGKLALWKGRPAPDDMAPEVKGLEVQRSDETRYTQQLLKEFIDILLSPDVDPLDIDNRLIAEAKKFYTIAPPRELIEITKTVTKPPSEYRPMTTAARIAQQMIDNGREFFVGMKIPFIVVDHTPIIKAIHADEYVDKFDREYYWSKRILPPILRLVHARFPKYSFRDFENPMQEQFNFDDKPAKVKKMRSVKKVRKVVAPVKRIKKPPVFTIHIPDGATKPTISGIALLAKSMKGNCKIHVSVNMCDADAIIHTDTMVSRDCLKEISKMFNVAITPKPV
jgi:DNA polymerase elongation subunit (family B)